METDKKYGSLDYTLNIENISVNYEWDTDTLDDRCVFTVKSIFKLKKGDVVIEKHVSNSFVIDDEMIKKEFREAGNREEIIDFAKRKLNL